MPLNKEYFKRFHICLYGQLLQTIKILKRDDDQREGTVTTYTLYDCRRSQITKLGEALLGEMSSIHRTRWHVPRVELDRVGIKYINVLDRIVDLQEQLPNGDYVTYQPESPQEIELKLVSQHVCIEALRVN